MHPNPLRRVFLRLENSMSAGTINLTNNSSAVTGTGTLFSTDLKANDFIVVIVGGVTYTLGIKSVESATALTLITAYSGPTGTGNAWTAVPNATLVGITAQVAADVVKAIRGLNLDKANWQQVFSGTGTITVTLPDGSTYTGPAWSSITASLAGKAEKGANSDITSLSGLTQAITVSQGGTGATSVTAARTALGVNYGTTAGTVAQGNDVRLDTVNNKTGGNLSSAITNAQCFTARGGIPSDIASAHGVSMSWSNTDGNALFQNNSGGGFGRYIFRVVNATNTAEITRFTMNENGLGQSPAGWVSTCDEGVKDKITEINPEKALKAICSWRAATWKYYDVPSELDEKGNVISVVKGASGVGFIAQDVELDCPDAVTSSGESSLFVTDDGELFSVENVKSLNTSGATAAYAGAAIKAIVDILLQMEEDPGKAFSTLREIKKSSDEAISKRKGVAS